MYINHNLCKLLQQKAKKNLLVRKKPLISLWFFW